MSGKGAGGEEQQHRRILTWPSVLTRHVDCLHDLTIRSTVLSYPPLQVTRSLHDAPSECRAMGVHVCCSGSESATNTVRSTSVG